ncbi:MAG: hypothetical protein EXR73_14875 [Myxococcales bacterium]|nr:hypothetical protein [Myxococcales bacterium]
MSRTSFLGTAMLTTLTTLTACGPTGDDQPSCAAALLPGDLVLSEVLANPAGDDAGNEWFELVNAGSTAADLVGLTLVSSRADGLDEKTHRVTRGLLVDPGAYVVLGGVRDELRPGFVDYGFASELGTLRNESGRLALRCGDTLLDEVRYADMDSGVAQGFSGALSPDHIANDDPANWCGQMSQFSPMNFGTPGEANDACRPVVPDTMCDDNGTLREIVPPPEGALVITEVMANPSAAGDDTGEWFELHVTADGDLNGLEIGRTPGAVDSVVSSVTCIHVTAGADLVIARVTDPLLNGGLARVDGLFDFGMTNSGGRLFVGRGGVVYDAITWTSVGDGKSRSLDPGRTDPVQNDDALGWCEATSPYGAGDRGTPGAPNVACPIVVPPGMCLIGTNLRTITPATPGDLVITEVMPNPSAVSDTAGEWFEVLVTRDIDLNGLELGKAAGAVLDTVAAADCIGVAAGTRLVFAHGDLPATNGGLPQVDRIFSFALVNSSDGVFVGVGGALIDAITWTASADGATTSLDPDLQNATDNDLATSFCPAPADATYGAGDRGTPGGANPQCP